MNTIQNKQNKGIKLKQTARCCHIDLTCTFTEIVVSDTNLWR